MTDVLHKDSPTDTHDRIAPRRRLLYVRVCLGTDSDIAEQESKNGNLKESSRFLHDVTVWGSIREHLSLPSGSCDGFV